MRIRINGEERTLALNELTVTEVLKTQNVEMPEMVSVQVNGGFLARDAFGTTLLKDGDAVDFLYFMGGGAGQ